MLSDTPVLPPRRDYAEGGEPYRVRTGYALDKRPPCLYRHHPYGQETYSLSHLLQFNDPRLHPEIPQFLGLVLCPAQALRPAVSGKRTVHCGESEASEQREL